MYTLCTLLVAHNFNYTVNKFPGYMSFQPGEIFEFSWAISPISIEISHFCMHTKVKLSLVDKSRLLVTKNLKGGVLPRLNSQWLMCQVYPFTTVYSVEDIGNIISVKIYNVMYFD